MSHNIFEKYLILEYFSIIEWILSYYDHKTFQYKMMMTYIFYLVYNIQEKLQHGLNQRTIIKKIHFECIKFHVTLLFLLPILYYKVYKIESELVSS